MFRFFSGFLLSGFAAVTLAQAPATGGAQITAPASLAAAAQPPAPEIGTVERLNGTVTVTPAGAPVRPLAAGDAVREGDLIITEAHSEALIKLRDETTLAMRQSSQLRLTQFRFERGEGDSFLSNLLKGSVRKVSGLIAKAQQRNVRVTTPTATIGIRGTDFEITIIEEESEKTRAGTYDFVNDGATVLQIASGETLNVDQDQTGLALAFPRPGEAALQLIQGRPAFLRGGGFDAMMMQNARPPMIMMPGRR
jgi:FecR protein